MRRPIFAIALAAACCGVLRAQDAPIEVNPNRPTFASPSLTTQPGVAEVEFGVQQTFQRDESTVFSSPTLLKLGIVKDFEVRISSNGYLRNAYPDDPAVTGPADVALGLQWCFVHDGLLGTDMAVQFTHKFATAGLKDGLSVSGEPDDTLGFFISRDFGKNHVDLNFFQSWLGQSEGSVRQPAFALSASHGFTDTWSMGGEVYALGGYQVHALGVDRVNTRVVSNLWYVAYKVSSRLVLDTGVDIGLNQGAQKYSVFAGLTYGIGRFRRP
jgi:hypothetical protein